MVEFDVLAYIHQSNLIEGFDKKVADEQSLQAWAWLLEQPELSHNVIMRLQSMIVSHQDDLKPEWRGLYRKIPVYIGGREAMQAIKIPAAMYNWLQNVPTARAHAHHVEFENIHPFVDGNGRTGRMLMWYMQMKQGIKPTLITYADRATYYKWFSNE